MAYNPNFDKYFKGCSTQKTKIILFQIKISKVFEGLH